MLKKRKTFIPFNVIEAADRGDAEARMKLGKAFEKGLTSEEHNILRRQAYCLKAEKGDPFAQYWMGFLCSMIDRNAKMAVYWYERSAEQGNTEAMRDLALGYSEYLNTADLDYGPVPLGYDKNKELFWLRRAAYCGDKKAISRLQRPWRAKDEEYGDQC